MSVERPSRSSTPNHRGSRAAALAGEQRGTISWWQLRGLGFAAASISDMVARGLLHRLWPGVYAFGHRVLTRDGWLFAATLACGDGSVLTARASSAARGLMPAWSTIDVITSTKTGVTLDGLRAHRAVLRPEERDVHRGLPVASLARTALDMAAIEGADHVGELLDRALLEGQYDHAEMQDLLAARRGCRGVAILRQAVDSLGGEGIVFRSRVERIGRDLIRSTTISDPRVNAWFSTRSGHGYELDLWWPQPRVNVEIDGPQHRLPHQRAKDARRDADLRSFGVRVTRVPDLVVTDEPERFLAQVRAALRSAGSGERPCASVTPKWVGAERPVVGQCP